MKINKLCYFIIIFVFVVVVLTLGSHNNKSTVSIYLPSLLPEQGGYLDSNNLIGEPYVLNIFNSWCTSCNEEHNLWFSIKDQVKLYGISYVDNATQVVGYLKDHGNPYIITGFDKRGITREELNITALPESFIFDKFGKVRLHIVGKITQEKLDQEILPLYSKLLQE